MRISVVSFICLVAAVILSMSVAEARRNRGFFHKLHSTNKLRSRITPGHNADLCAQFTYFNQNIDHFNFNPTYDSKFKQRYIISDMYWNNASGPIFFYTGNEGDIQWFCENTGFVWEIAKQFNALVVFAEHRYYGTSLPFGNDSFTSPYIHFLSSAQALADYAYLIKYLKSTVPGASDSPVIAFGGSYGGMLASWFRMKYPNIVAGSIAASAPIWQFTADCDSFSGVTTSAFRKADTKCPDIIRESWDAINSMSGSDEGLKQLTEIFRLCDPLKSGDVLKDWLGEIYGDVAMGNYPYTASFLAPLPPWPVKAMCQNITNGFFDETSNNGKINDPVSILKAIVNGVNVYQNYTGDKKCFDVGSSSAFDSVMVAWGYQTCTEFVFPMCNDGKRDMFEPAPWDPKGYDDACRQTYKTNPRDEWPTYFYGETPKDIRAHSNIVFSNGDLDPWSAGGVLVDINDSVISIMIENGAHHLDLRSSNPNDPKSVITARLREIDQIQRWIEEWNR